MLFSNKKDKTPYLRTIDELEHVRIVRLKGNIDQSMVHMMESRIQENRKREGVVIDKNIIIDYADVKNVDTATIAFHLVRLKEFEAAGHCVGFINVSDKLHSLLDMFKQSDSFRIYASEELAISELNKNRCQ